MIKKIITIIIVTILIVLVVGAAYLWKQQPVEKINPYDLIVFEIKNKELSEWQISRFEENITQAKSEIDYNTEQGKEYESDWNFNHWLAIASIQKAIGDYERAEKLWIWFTDVYVGNSISPANLGDLYKSFVINPEKSEKYYKIALEREKNDFNIYFGLYELYLYRFEDSQKAINTLKEGLANNPNEINYVNYLVKYLLELGRKNEAEEIIEEFILTHPEATDLRNKLK